MPFQGNLTAIFQKCSLYISVPPNISVKFSYWFPGYLPLIPFYKMWKITGTPLNPSLSSRDQHQQELVTFLKLSYGFWEEPRSISKGVEQAPLSKESWELAIQLCIFVSFEWETFWITGNILTFFFFPEGGRNGWWAQQRTQCVILGTGGAAHGIPHVACTADKAMSHCKGCRSPVPGYGANWFCFSFKWNNEVGLESVTFSFQEWPESFSLVWVQVQ